MRNSKKEKDNYENCQISREEEREFLKRTKPDENDCRCPSCRAWFGCPNRDKKEKRYKCEWTKNEKDIALGRMRQMESDIVFLREKIDDMERGQRARRNRKKRFILMKNKKYVDIRHQIDNLENNICMYDEGRWGNWTRYSITDLILILKQLVDDMDNIEKYLDNE